MKLTQSLVAIAALSTLTSTLSFAGGDINPITVFEQEAIVVPVTPVPVPAPAPVFVAPTPTPKVVAPPAVVAPIVAAAPLGLYLAGGLTDIAVRSGERANFFSEKLDQDRQVGFTGRLGYDFMDYLGAELRGTYGFAKDNGTKFKQIGAYLKPNYDLTDELNLYGLVGASKTNGAGTGTNTGLSYGAGLDYGITDSISVFTDVVNYMKKSNTASQWGATIGAAYQF
jgi:opacity protein-like surface antigen